MSDIGRNAFPSRQTGLTLSGFLFLLALIGFFTLLGLKIGPIYFEHYKVVTCLKSLEQEPDIGSKTKSEILTLLEKRFDINMVTRVSAENVSFARATDGLKVQIAYEAVENVLGNADVLVRFNDSIEVKSN